MASSLASLDAASNERKARLAKLKSLKRKRPDDGDANGTSSTAQPSEDQEAQEDSVAATYLSGRNYDVATRGPKLGFEIQPGKDQNLLEKQAEEVATATRIRAEEEDKADKPIDLLKLQPKKPNWDLKRDLDRKLERLNVQTSNAIARMVRERIAEQKKAQAEEGEADGENGDGEAETANMQGGELLESVHQREREAEQESADEYADTSSASEEESEEE